MKQKVNGDKKSILCSKRRCVQLIFLSSIVVPIVLMLLEPTHDKILKRQSPVLPTSKSTLKIHHQPTSKSTLKIHHHNNMKSNLKSTTQQPRSTRTPFKDIPKVQVHCSYAGKNMTQEETDEIRRTLESLENRTKPGENCKNTLKATHRPPSSPYYPLAFSLLVHNNPGIVDILIRLMFRPEHSFCLFVDKKAKDEVQTAFRSIVRCYNQEYPNTTFFIPDDIHNVVWGESSIVLASLKCLRYLREKNKEWHYALNWAGTNLPMLTIGELENTLRVEAKGRSVMEVLSDDEFKVRVGDHYGNIKVELPEIQVITLKNGTKVNVTSQLIQKSISTSKGIKEAALSRDYVDFVLDSDVANAFLNFLQEHKIRHNEEHFYSTLYLVYYNITKEELKEMRSKLSRYWYFGRTIALDPALDLCVRLSLWDLRAETRLPCSTRYRNNICMYGMNELPYILGTGCLTANKFDLRSDPVAVACVYEHMLKREEALSKTKFK